MAIDLCCGVAVDPWSDKEPYYPQCEGCREKPPVANAKSRSVPVSSNFNVLLMNS